MKDFATSLIVTPPAPANSGITLTVQSGHGVRFPATPFLATVHPALLFPDLDNAEKVQVTDITGDVLTIERALGDTTAKTIATGWRISNTLFVENIEDLDDDAVDSVNGYTGTVVLTKTDVGLGNVDNTSDVNKPISDATQDALDALESESEVVTLGLTAGTFKVSSYANFSVAINAAYSYLDGLGGGILELLGDTFNAVSTIYPKSNIITRGSGNSTLINIPASCRISLEGQHDLVFEDIKFDGTNQSTLNDHVIRIRDSYNIHLTRLNVQNAQGFGVFVEATSTNTCHDIWIKDSVIGGLANYDVIGGGPANSTGALVYNIYIDNCTVSQDTTQVNSGSYQNAFDIVASKNIKITSSTFYGNVVPGFEQYPKLDYLIDNNTIYPAIGGSTAGIIVTTNSSPLASDDGMIITNNTIKMGEIRLEGNATYKILNFHIADNNITVPTGRKAVLLQNALYGTVHHNIITGVAASTGNWGVYLDGADNVDITNNTINGVVIDINSATTFTNVRIFENSLNASTTTNRLVGLANANSYNNHGVDPTKYADNNNPTNFNRINGQSFRSLLSANVTPSFSSGLVKGSIMTIFWTQNGTGGYTVTPSGTNTKFIGGSLTISPDANAVTTTNLMWDGSDWREYTPRDSSLVHKAGDTMTGLLRVDNTANSGHGLELYSNGSTTSLGYIADFRIDNPLYGNPAVLDQDNGVVNIQNASTQTALHIQQTTELEHHQNAISVESVSTTQQTKASQGLVTFRESGTASTNTLFELNNVGTGSTIFVRQNGNGNALNVLTRATTANAILISQTDTTTGPFTSANGLIRFLLPPSATGRVMRLDQQGSGDNLYIVNSGTGGNAIKIVNTATAGETLRIDTTGSNESVIDSNVSTVGFSGTGFNAAHRFSITDATSTGQNAEFAQTGSGRNVFINTDGNGISLEIDSESTTASTVYIDAGAAFTSNFGSVRLIIPTGATGKGIRVEQMGTGNGQNIIQTGNGLPLNVVKTITDGSNNTGTVISSTSIVTNAGTITKSDVALAVSSAATRTSGTITNTSKVATFTQSDSLSSGNVVEVLQSGTGSALTVQALTAADMIVIRTSANSGTDAGYITMIGRARFGYNGSQVLISDAGSTKAISFISGGAERLNVGTGGDVTIPTVGGGILIKEGTNAKMGVATMVAGTVTVSTTKVTASSRIFLTVQSLGTVAVPTPIAVTARTAATSFTITSASVTDTSVVAWQIIEPA